MKEEAVEVASFVLVFAESPLVETAQKTDGTDSVRIAAQKKRTKKEEGVRKQEKIADLQS